MLNQELAIRRERAVPRGVVSSCPIFAARAQNSELWDITGRRFIDFSGGIGVLNVGHRHPRVVAAVQTQLALYTHTAFQVAPYAPYIELAERLNAIAPFQGPAKTALFTTGAEATENAIKISRASTGRAAVIAFAGGFHGRTLLSMAMTGKAMPYKHQFGPMPGEIYHAPFPVAALGIGVKESLAAIDTILRADVGPERVAAIIIEPVQGEGGFHEAPAQLLMALRTLCDEHGIVLIADEVQAGFGRTGKMFSIEHSNVEPDLVTIAKSMAGGFPLSGVIGRASVMDAVEPGGLGGTYAGNPIACAAALAVLDLIEEEKLLQRAIAIGRKLRERIWEISKRSDIVPIAHIRGLGAMVGFDVVKKCDGYEPDAEATRRITESALEEGLILLSCGTFGNIIRILVPLTASELTIDEGMERLQAALRKAI